MITFVFSRDRYIDVYFEDLQITNHDYVPFKAAVKLRDAMKSLAFDFSFTTVETCSVFIGHARKNPRTKTKTKTTPLYHLQAPTITSREI